MVRKQVLVQLDDALVSRLDAAAETAGVSRSELLRRAAQALLAALENVEHDRRLRAAYRRHPEENDAFVDAAARHALEELDKW